MREAEVAAENADESACKARAANADSSKAAKQSKSAAARAAEVADMEVVGQDPSHSGQIQNIFRRDNIMSVKQKMPPYIKLPSNTQTRD